jgi:hypothetical protein
VKIVIPRVVSTAMAAIPALAETFEIRIFRCTACATACSILPSFLKRHHTASADVDEWVTRMNVDGIALGVIAEQLSSVLVFSEMWN